MIRVSRFADDPPVPGPDTPEARVYELPMDDRATELELLVFYEDREKGARFRRYVSDGRCVEDRDATPDELEENAKRVRELEAAGGFSYEEGRP